MEEWVIKKEEAEARLQEIKDLRIKLPKYRNETVHVRKDCYRCGATGIYTRFHGACWTCNGTGWVYGRGYRKIFPAGTTAEELKVYEEELERRKEANRLKTKIKRFNKIIAETREKEERKAQFLAENPGVEKVFELETDRAVNLKMQFDRYGRLTEKQTLMAFDMLRKNEERQEAHDAAEDAPEGRVRVKGKILTIKDTYTEWGAVQKMLFLDNRGFKVWCTTPRKTGGVAVGDELAMDVTLEPKKDDPKFAWGKRPKLINPEV